MSTEILASILALSGIVFSVLISYLSSRLQIKNELQKLRIEAESAYTSKLFEKRFEVYPKLFEITSSFAKKIRSGETTLPDYDSFVQQMYEWDNKNSIFVSPITLQELVEMLQLIRKSNKAFRKNGISKKDLREEFIPQLTDLELSLKTELGVFARGGYHSPAEIKRLKDYLNSDRQEEASDE